ncbi:MAG: class I SAM-dependent methyltransferase [Alphaproteobacteria bacterium]|nr:class I SAM-dependent methyltransferase [Alphaproteobacteria bacterium]
MPDPWLPGVHPTPNLQDNPDLYELENRALDPEGRLFAAMRAHADWAGRDVLDLGAGDGFWAPHFHQTARHVFAMEPDDASRLRAMARFARLGLARTSALTGSAARILLPDDAVDLVHVRFAYFWGPGCEPGLAELARVLRPGGWAFIIDNDGTQGTFAAWLRAAAEHRGQAFDPTAHEDFWRDQGFTTETVRSVWRFERRADLEAVVRNELRDPGLADRLLVDHEGLEVDYAFRLRRRCG